MFSVNVKFSVPLLCVYVCILLERPSPKWSILCWVGC